jgi:hypothetical protein
LMNIDTSSTRLPACFTCDDRAERDGIDAPKRRQAGSPVRQWQVAHTGSANTYLFVEFRKQDILPMTLFLCQRHGLQSEPVSHTHIKLKIGMTCGNKTSKVLIFLVLHSTAAVLWAGGAVCGRAVAPPFYSVGRWARGGGADRASASRWHPRDLFLPPLSGSGAAKLGAAASAAVAAATTLAAACASAATGISIAPGIHPSYTGGGSSNHASIVCHEAQSLLLVCCDDDDGHISSVHNQAPGLTISIATKKW